MRRLPILLGLALLTGCIPPKPAPRYELGSPYQVRGVWFYPNETDTLDDTGLASVYGSGHAPLTANGEVFDPAIATAGHPTVQLPAIARLTNLENGRSILVRINDRGSGNPARLIDVTRRAAALLAMRDGAPTRVRLKLLPEESHAAADALPGRPRLAVAMAPRAAVAAVALAPPGTRQETVRPVAATGPTVSDQGPATIDRLPETVTQEPANPRRLWVRLDTFEEYQYAATQRVRMRYLGATMVESFDGRVHRFTARVGPFDTARQAEDTQADAFARGIPDARIVVE